MLSNQDISQISRMLFATKKELRNDFWRRDEYRFEDNKKTNESVDITEMALCDIDEAIDSRMADIENALCELDEE